MENFLNEVAETYFHGHIDLFGGPGSTFVRFQMIEHSTSEPRMIFNTFVGHIVYKRQGVSRGSRLIQVKYYDSEMYAPCWGVLVPWMNTELWFCETVLPAFRWMGKVHVHDVIPILYAFEHQSLDATASTKCAILWEDLDGFKVCSRATLLDYQHLSMMARKIAQFHSFSFGVRVKRPQFFSRQVSMQSVTKKLILRDEFFQIIFAPILNIFVFPIINYFNLFRDIRFIENSC